MTTTDDPIDQLARAADHVGRLIAGIEPDQTELPTPCPDWTVAQLARHAGRDVLMFTARARGEPWQEHTPDLGRDWAATFDRAAGDLVAAWRQAGSLDEKVELPFGTVTREWFVGQQLADLVVHGWDLARATGQPADANPDLAEAAFAWGRENLKPEFRGTDFGPEVEVPAGAAPIDRAVGVFGRDPDWRPASQDA
jgi:uncharacterized protein (TIGR03086 family)